MLIPTSFKEKLPKTNSYPLGAEIVSRALEGLECYPFLGIWFSARDTSNIHIYNQIIKELGEIRVFDFVTPLDKLKRHGYVCQSHALKLHI